MIRGIHLFLKREIPGISPGESCVNPGLSNVFRAEQ